MRSVLSDFLLRGGSGEAVIIEIGLETDEGSERIKAAYGANYERLVAVKKQVGSD